MYTCTYIHTYYMHTYYIQLHIYCTCTYIHIRIYMYMRKREGEGGREGEVYKCTYTCMYVYKCGFFFQFLWMSSVLVPFCREYRTKFNLTWNQSQTQVNYDLNITYVFEPDMSSGDPKKDHIISLNLPLYVSECLQAIH